MLVINNNQECQQNPTLAIYDLRHNHSNIRTLIDFNMTEKQYSFMQ